MKRLAFIIALIGVFVIGSAVNATNYVRTGSFFGSYKAAVPVFVVSPAVVATVKTYGYPYVPVLAQPVVAVPSVPVAVPAPTAYQNVAVPYTTYAAPAYDYSAFAVPSYNYGAFAFAKSYSNFAFVNNYGYGFNFNAFAFKPKVVAVVAKPAVIKVAKFKTGKIASVYNSGTVVVKAKANKAVAVKVISAKAVNAAYRVR